MYTVSEESLYLHYAQLDRWELADLVKLFRKDDYRHLFGCVRRHVSVAYAVQQCEALRYGL